MSQNCGAQPSGDGNGDVNRLVGLAYDYLRERARLYLDHERADHTLQPTALVHEAYIRIVQQDEVIWVNDAQVKAIAAQMMWRILVDHARGKGAERRGGGRCRTMLRTDILSSQSESFALVEVVDTLDKLARLDERQNHIVRLKWLSGLTNEEIASYLCVSKSTVEKSLRHAKAWLKREL